MKKCDKILKNVQRKLLDFIQTRQGLTLLCISFLLIIIFTLQLSETIMEYHFLRPKCVLPADQIDLVYTWVNGSDPDHQRLVKKHKLDQIKLNTTQIELHQLGQLNKTYCHYKYCIAPNNLIVITPKLSRVDKQHFLLKSKTLLDASLYSNITIDSYPNVLHSQDWHNQTYFVNDISLVQLNNYDFIKNTSLINQLNGLFRITLLNKPYKFYVGYYTIDCDMSPNCVRLNRTYLAKRFRERLVSRDYLSFNTLPQTGLELPAFLKNNTILEKEYEHEPELVFDPSKEIKNKVVKKNTIRFKMFKVRSKEAEFYVQNMTKMDSNDNGIDLDFFSLYLVWDLGNGFMDDFSPNRFQDNNELKYSLRSVQMFAPWIRNVFIVTNGQVPSWLNTSHPRLRLINHSDIFEDKSHLPTFSSNAIESHLHQIQGLSQKFLYFNDDVFLGRPIYLDDFYSASRGYRFHLAWQLPGCNQNCPNSWIRDGYCDKACNTTECEYDGGDCLSSNLNNSGRQSFLNQSYLITSEFYCSAGCSNSWLADKYCDYPCNNPACAYDMGDCGLEDLVDLYSIKIYNLSDQLVINSPKNTKAFYLNFTKPEDIRFVKAEYTENKAVRLVSAVNKFKCLIVLLISEPADFEISIEYTHSNRTDKSKILIRAGTFDLKQKSTTALAKQNLNLTDIEPVQIQLDKIKDSSVDKKYNLKLFDDLHKNYMDFLTWSVKNQLLTEHGRLYKISYFNHKMSELSLKYRDNPDPVNYVYNFIFGDQFTDKQMLRQYAHDEQLEDANLIKIFHKRKLLDTFADSLKNVNKLYNEVYGYAVRKVPAHMPHLIDTKLMSQLNEKFKQKFEQTSSHKFRHESDMQYAFSYYYYVMSESVPLNASIMFDEFDTNKNGFLDPIEITVLNLRLSPKNFETSDYEMDRLRVDFDTVLSQCMNTSGLISREKFLSCDDLVEFLGAKFWPGIPSDERPKRWKYTFETVGDEDTKFIMAGDNEHDLEVKLNNLVRSPKKFICLNDNIDYKLQKEAHRLKVLIKNFYEQMYPIPSGFELTQNPADHEEVADKNTFLILLIALSFCVLFLICSVKKFCCDKESVTKYRREYRVSAALRRRMKKTKNETSSISTSSENESEISTSFKKNLGLFMRSKFKRIRKNRPTTLDNI